MALRFSTLLYRYFFFGWLFQDVRSNNPFARAACWTHNKHQARWLPVYLRRWSTISASGYLLGAIAEVGLRSPALSTVFFVPAAVGVTVVVVILAAIIGFKVLSGPL